MTVKKGIRIVFWVAFVVYLFAVIGIMFLGGRHYRPQGDSFWVYVSRSVNLIPFHTIGEYIFHVGRDTAYLSLAIRNIGGNLLLFLPMGFFLPALFPLLRKLWKVVLTVCATVLLAECLQLFLRRGIFDIDDLILNLTGAVFGYFIYWIFSKISCQKTVSCDIL